MQSIEQLFKVKTLYEAKLVSELVEQAKKKYPHLLDKPKTIEASSLPILKKTAERRIASQ